MAMWMTLWTFRRWAPWTKMRRQKDVEFFHHFPTEKYTVLMGNLNIYIYMNL